MNSLLFGTSGSPVLGNLSFHFNSSLDLQWTKISSAANVDQFPIGHSWTTSSCLLSFVLENYSSDSVNPKCLSSIELNLFAVQATRSSD